MQPTPQLSVPANSGEKIGRLKAHNVQQCLQQRDGTFRYEEEEEFDSLTDNIKPKTVVLIANPTNQTSGRGAAADRLRAALQGVVFNTAVCSTSAAPFAQQLWAGRDGPPFFSKIRTRPALDAAADDPVAAQAVWAELLGQNWRVELDYGLGVDIPQKECLLLVASASAVEQLLTVAGLSVVAHGGSHSSSSSSVVGGSVVGKVQPGSLAALAASGGSGAGSWESQSKKLLLYTSDLDDVSSVQQLLSSSKV
ncbi:hypothetical protein N2152v2_009225 [Parachlorella kessleri]